MNCMKCGREVAEGQVFCEFCLEDMEREPVKINTPVMIPTQPPKTAASYRRPLINPEEEMKRLEKTNQNLILMLVLAVVTAVLMGLLAYHREVWAVVEELGRNYSVIETTMP